jgi:hypothetical protein
MWQMADMREEIDDILVDCKDEDEQLGSWEVAFMDEANVPFQATLLDIPVEVQAFRANDSNVMQCQVLRAGKQRWVSVEDLDVESLPQDCRHLVELYSAWVSGDY